MAAPISAPGSAPGPTPGPVNWRGTALGAPASLTIHHPDETKARRLIQAALNELARLEAVFSLYRPDSALSRLNRAGALEAPPLDLVALLSEAKRWSARTDGAFDATVQPLWRLYAEHFARPGADPAGPPAKQVAAARALADYRALEIGPARIALARPGMALTLNGIAQGYITDRVAELLRAQGLDRVLVELGEIRALGAGPGAHSEDRGWRVGVADPDRPGALLDTLEIADRAVATSAANGTLLDAEGRMGHILNPRNGGAGSGYLAATVVARRAADADALSTALVADAAMAGLIPRLQGRGMRRLGIDRVLILDRDRVLRSL